MNNKLSMTALLVCTTPLWAAGTKQPAKPPVKGTTQLAGSDAKPGMEYTLGKASNINFQLDSAEFRVDRINMGDESITAKGDEKILLINFTVHNPNKTMLYFDWATVNLTAVDLQNVNHECTGQVGRKGTGEKVALELKPGQKLAVFRAIVVPGKGIVPKLVVQASEGGKVLRYDLRKTVKAIPAPYADKADASGATALGTFIGETGKFYSLTNWDVKLVSGAYANGPLGDAEAGEGKRFFLASVTLKNGRPTNSAYDTSVFAPVLVTADGEKTEFANVLLKTTRNENAMGELKPGEEYTARFAFAIPKDATAKTLLFAEPESRVVSLDVSGVK